MEPLSLPIGVEEEYQLCDPESGDLKPAVEALLGAADAELRARLGYELLHTVLEGNIEKSADVAAAMTRVRALRCDVLETAASLGVAIGVGGVHPFARWQDQDFVDTEAYQWVGRQLQYLARRNLSFGLHVHVQVEPARVVTHPVQRNGITVDGGDGKARCRQQQRVAAPPAGHVQRAPRSRKQIDVVQ